MASRQENTTGGLPLANQVARSRGAHDAVLADNELLDTIGGPDLGYLLDDFGVVVAAIATDDEESVLSAFRDGEEGAGDEGLGVVLLLEDLDLLAQARAGGCQLDNNCIKRRAIDVRSGLLVAKRLDGNGLDRHGGVAGAGK